jgi:hypothetical protein
VLQYNRHIRPTGHYPRYRWCSNLCTFQATPPRPPPPPPVVAAFDCLCRFEVLDSHFHYDVTNYNRPLIDVPVTDFFGSVSAVRPTPDISSTSGDLGSTNLQAVPPVAVHPAAAAGAQGSSSSSSSSRGFAAAGLQAPIPRQLLSGSSRSSGSSSIGAGSTQLPNTVYWGLLSLLAAVLAAAVLQPQQGGQCSSSSKTGKVL